jgi:HAD superfamily hydrolase (TIGR01509 family)
MAGSSCSGVIAHAGSQAQQLELVIFDCDGVLVDSEIISNEVLARALTREGLPTMLIEARRDYQGLLLTDVVSRAQARLGRALSPGWLAEFERDRAAAFRNELKPVEGAAEAVTAIAAARIAVCVASQGSLEKTRRSLELTGLRSLFPERSLFSAESVPRGKPHPDLFLQAASVMGATPARCAVVEDTASGVTAAVAAGMRTIGYTGDSDPVALQRAGAELLDSLDQLPALLQLQSRLSAKRAEAGARRVRDGDGGGS